MLPTYNRLQMVGSKNDELVKIYGNSDFKTGLEWNQYMGVLPYIEYGMFQSAIKIIETINIKGLENLKAWLLKSLAEGEDRYE